MPDDAAHHLNFLKCQADFTYSITVKEIKIQDTGKGAKPVADDLGAVLRKIEGWHQGSIVDCRLPHQLPWDGWDLASDLLERQGSD